MVEDGDLEFRYYRIKINLDYHLSPEFTAWHLEKIFDVSEVIVGDRELGDDGKIVAFVRIKSTDEIMNLGTTIDLCGFRCTISHLYLYT